MAKKDLTREEAIEELEHIRRIGNGESSYKNDRESLALDMAIKALKQEPILDKIRAEISTEIEKDYGHYDIITAQGIRTGYLSALSIIDKYKEESKEGADNAKD